MFKNIWQGAALQLFMATLISLPSWADVPPLPAMRVIPPVRYVGIEHGLSNNAVTGVYQDDKGFMWFTTYDGLNRYDGNIFTVFRNRIGDSASLRGNENYTIAADREHNLWIGGRNGVSVYHPGRNTFNSVQYISSVDHQVRPVSFTVPNIVSDRQGSMLIGTERGGMLVFANDKQPGQQVSLQTGTSMTDAYSVSAIETVKATGDVWVFVQNVGLCRYMSGERRVIPVNGQIRQGNCLRADGAGNLWLGNDNGLYVYNIAANAYSSSRIEGAFKISSLCIDKAGTIWVASDGRGILEMGASDTKARPFLSPEGKQVINSSAVYAIYEDLQGRKWVGTLRGGVNIIGARANPIRTVVYNAQKATDPNNNFILSFCEDPSNNVWIGTDGGGLRYWDRHKDSYTIYTHDPGNSASVASNFITGILNDAQHDIWVSAWFGGVSRWNKTSRQFSHYSCYNPYTHNVEDRVWLIYEDGRKTLWASTSNDGTLYTLNRETDKFEIFDSSIVNIQCLAEDRAGDLWGGDYSSLIKIDRAGKKHRRYRLGYTVRCIHEDKEGRFWVGTQGGGLLLLDRVSGQYKRFDDADGLPSNTILRILEDREGNLWMSTFNGLIRYDAREKSFRNFSQSDGLQSNQFSFNAAIALRSGEFVFGGIKGFNIFYPDSVYGPAPVPAIFLTGIRTGEKTLEVEEGRTITIPYDKAALSFDFVAPEYSVPDKIQYAYYLEGWDKSWNISYAVRTANYTRLQEGTYHFMIKATNALGGWGNAKEVLTIVVLPPWYRSWWAWCLYCCGLIGVIYLYLKYTQRQERLRYEIKLAHLENEKDKELNEKKLSFFTNVSHEFRTPLTLIINPLKEAVRDQEKKGGDRDLTVAYRNARRLLSLVDQLLLFRKADSGADMLRVSRLDIADLCHEVFQCFLQQARQKSIDYQFEASVGLPAIYADREKLEIALFNLLSNAFKFTPDGGMIGMKVSETDAGIGIGIADSGCGISEADGKLIFQKFRQADPAKGPHKTGFGIGLYLVKHFIEDHRGSLSFDSLMGEGTTFTVTLQKGTAHLPPHYFVDEQPADHGLLEELSPDGDMPAGDSPGEALKEEGKKAEEMITDKRSVLLIDDDDEIRQYLGHLFSEKYIVYKADNGVDGLRLAQQHVPDLVISDINMTGMDGVALCQAIKRSEMLGHIPVILLTAEAASDMKLKGIEGGADDYITKPFDSGLLQARVETMLKNRNLLQRYFFDSITLKESTIKVPAEFQDFLRKCIEAIEKNIDAEDFSTQKFAQVMGMSRSGLYQKVKSISGQSLNAFVRSIRLRRAAVLMLRENLNVNQAAFQVGIGDTRYFREQFVKLFDMTPSEYIKRYRNSFNRDFNVIHKDE